MKRKPTPAARRRGHAPDATTEPDPGPAPEAVFDRVTGPYARPAIPRVSVLAYEEDA